MRQAKIDASIKTKEQKIRLSWLTKIAHSEFITQTHNTLDILERKLKQKSFIPDVAFNQTRELIDKMAKLQPSQRPHELTRTINKLHATRKKQLTSIRQQIRLIAKDKLGVYSSQQSMDANRVSNWLHGIYGTRHYDLGIGVLSQKIDNMIDDLENDHELLSAFNKCVHSEILEDLKNTNKTLNQYHLQRNVDMAERMIAPRFDELRAKIYECLKSLVRMVDDMIRMEKVNKLYIEIKNTIYNYLNPKRANWMQQCTKRRLRREKDKQENEILSINWEQNLMQGYLS